MRLRNVTSICTAALLLLFSSVPAGAQKKGMKSITADELYTHLNFIAADELAGRNTPSPELKIASRYLAALLENYGLKPLMPDGSFFQKVPLEITSVSGSRSWLSVISDMSEQVFYYPQAFSARISSPYAVVAGVVFVGYGLYAPEQGWDDYGDIDLAGKIVVMLDGQLPETHELRKRENRRILYTRRTVPTTRGAAAVLTVVSPERENEMASSGSGFSRYERVRMTGDFPTQRRTSRQAPRQAAQEEAGRPPLPFIRVDVRHAVAEAVLGITERELTDMFSMIGSGRQVPGRELPGKRIELVAGIEKHAATSQNVVAVCEGSDRVLKNEYIVIGSHLDHLGVRNGQVMNGADDNGSGTVAMLEIAQALTIEKPKRSVILVWHTGEEKGLYGAHYFVNDCPVPVEKISANINLDMICRNDPDSLYLIASDMLSAELDASIHAMNDKYIKLNFDYRYDDRSHPDRFYYRSDHYPYMRAGIPAVWFFCGTTGDYHQPTDTIDRVDFQKMERVARLTYLVAYDIGNRKELLKLDVNPEVTARGMHNTSIESIR